MSHCPENNNAGLGTSEFSVLFSLYFFGQTVTEDMPLKNPRQTKSSAAAAKKEDLAQRVRYPVRLTRAYMNRCLANCPTNYPEDLVKEIKLRQKNWMQQRDEHLNQHSSSDHSHHINTETDAVVMQTSRSQQVDLEGSPSVSPGQVKDQASAGAYKSVVSDKLSFKAKPGFANWLQNQKETVGFKEDDLSHSATGSKNDSGARHSSDRPSMKDVSQQKGVPLSPSEFNSLADSIVNRVRKDLGIVDGPSHNTSGGSNMARGRTFVQPSNEDGRDFDSVPSCESIASHLDLTSHKCPYCNTLMLPSNHLPTLVVPCGHTLCKQCASSRSTCRMCGTRVASLTTNIMLQQIIEEFNRKSQRPHSGTEKRSPDVSSRRPQTRSMSGSVSYSAQLHNCMEREQALQEEMRTIRQELDQAVSQANRARRQLEAIQKEEQSLLEQKREIEERLRVMQEHNAEYTGECQRMQEKQKAAEERVALVERTMQSLREEIDKVKFLAEGQGEIPADNLIQQDVLTQ